MSTRESAALSELEQGLAIVLDSLRKLKTADDWVDQKHSPLGRRRHLEAVQRGDLVGNKVGTQVLVRREDLDRYIEKHRVVRARKVSDDETEQVAAEKLLAAGTSTKRRAG